MKRKFFLFLLIGLAFSLAGMQTVQAIPLFELDYEYSGGKLQQGTTPWLTAEFTDVLDGVELKLETPGLVGKEFVNKWLFNISPDVEDDVGSLTFSPFSPPLSSLGLTANFYDGGGAEGFDIELSFPDVDDYRFGIDISSITFGITSDKFDVTAALFDVFNSDANGPNFKTVAEVKKNVPNDTSSVWIAPNPNPNPVPEPATMLLVGMGLIGLAGFGRKRFKA